MFKFVHWMIVSRSQLLADLLTSTWPREFLVRLTQAEPDGVQSDLAPNNVSLVVIDLSTVDIQQAYQIQRDLEKRTPSVRVVFLHYPTSIDASFLLQCSNIAGVFTAATSLEEIGKGLKLILNGQVIIPADILNTALVNAENDDNDCLTIREREVLKALLSGSTNLDIANQLYVSESTIKTHLYRAFRKIGVSSRGQAIAWAQRNMHEVHI